MPNASEYRAAARRLRRMAVRVAHDVREVGAATDAAHIAGGPVRWALERSARDVVSCLDRAVAELDRLAAICELRADASDRAWVDGAVELLRDRGLATGRTPRVRP